MIHELKTVPNYYRDVLFGRKDFEVRENDRNFKLGDGLHLKEYNRTTEEYTGESTYRKIKYILNDPQYVKEGYVILGME